jgi:hypothetical protein
VSPPLPGTIPPRTGGEFLPPEGVKERSSPVQEPSPRICRPWSRQTPGPSFAQLTARLRGWTRDHDPHVRASAGLLIWHEHWLRRPTSPGPPSAGAATAPSASTGLRPPGSLARQPQPGHPAAP